MQGFQWIEAYGELIVALRNNHYAMGVLFWGVSGGVPLHKEVNNFLVMN